jgi:multiple sugar transport system permease protein
VRWLQNINKREQTKSIIVKQPKKKIPSLQKEESRAGYLFVLAPVLGFFIFALGPLIFSIYAGFTDWNGLGSMHFIGLDNYKELFTDTKFWQALWNTVYMMIGIPIGLIIALLLALAMNRDMFGAKAFRVIYYIPVVSSVVAISILWRWIYNGDYGLLNQILYSLFKIKGPSYLSNEATVKISIVMMMVWQGLGYTMLLYLAALQAIPKSYYEAAQLDGANAFQILKNITIPLLKPITFFLIITNIIGGSQVYVQPSIMTDNGGPNYSAATVVYYLWQKSFKELRMGYACSVAWILAIFIFIITFIQFKYNKEDTNNLE